MRETTVLDIVIDGSAAADRLADPKDLHVPRITLVFTLSGLRAQADLLHEFELHDGVSAVAHEVDGSPAIRIEAGDAVATVWDIRATVGIFDDSAVELGGHE